MSNALNVYRSANDLAYSELSPPAYGDLPPSHELDEDAIKKENAQEFLRFELAILQVSGAQDQLEVYAATQENLAQDREQPVEEEDPIWTQIQDGVKNQVNEVGSKIQDDHVHGSDDPEHHAIDDPAAKVDRYTESLAKTGVADQSFLSALLPSSTGEWIDEVKRRMGLNTIIEWWSSRNSAPECDEVLGDTEGLRQAERADALYSLLAAHHCRKKKHKTLLQLSGWGDSQEEETVFQMFLSSCSDDGWQRATCSFESSGTCHTSDRKIDICDSIKRARSRRIPVHLSFNHDTLWKAKRSLSFLSDYQMKAESIDLETILAQGELRAGDLDANVRKSRFALRLGLSLYSLLFGPWIQQELNSCNVHIIPDRDGSRIEMLDEAYISCRITTDWSEVCPRPAPNLEVNGGEDCPKLFLSFAQLLVDIANGEKANPPSGPDYNQLVDEVQRNQNNRLMVNYWNAIKGCLLYQANYESHGEFSTNQEKEKRLRAQDVIHEHIVRPLRNNLNLWKRQEKELKRRDEKGDRHGLELYGNEQRFLAQCPNCCSATAPLNPQDPGARKSVESKFTLWFQQDSEFTEIEEPTEDPSSLSFVGRMKVFQEAYIDTLPEPGGNRDIDKPVRVAVIDTGLFIEEPTMMSDGDHFLSDSDVSERVKDKQNFFSRNDEEPDPDDWKDGHGHGTLVARLVLQFAPRAEVVVAKISDSKTLRETRVTQLVNALKWAGERADIINLSFSLRSMAHPEVEPVIKDLISRQKLIFAAASNEGPLGSRKWPAKQPGVFAIHATNDIGVPDTKLNPGIESHGDNFAVFGSQVQSYWDGKHRSISGTSFASPVAAAIAANVLEIARRTLDKSSARGLTRYGAMRGLFRNHMSGNSVDGVYHVVTPWQTGLWDKDTPQEKIAEKIWNLVVGVQDNR